MANKYRPFNDVSEPHIAFEAGLAFRQREVISEMRRMVDGMTEDERFKKAQDHLYDALHYKKRRPDSSRPTNSRLYDFVYRWQTSKIWDFLLTLLGYVFMYVISFELPSQHDWVVAVQVPILGVFLLDIVLEVYQKSYQTYSIYPKYQKRFFVKMALIFLLCIDEAVFLSTYSTTRRQIRAFKFLRAFVPIMYDAITRKNAIAVYQAKRDMLVFVAFYILVVMLSGLVMWQIAVYAPGTEVDPYSGSYQSFSHAFMLQYVLGTYDSYPDYQMPAISGAYGVLSFMVAYILLNTFIFTVIPTTIILNSFRAARSKMIIQDEIKQQHSLVLAFVTLSESGSDLPIEKFTKFMLHFYKRKIRYIDCITEICRKLDDNNNGSVQISEFMDLCKIMMVNENILPPLTYDWQAWLDFRHWINEKLKIKELAKSSFLKFTVVLVVTWCVINGILLFTYPDVNAFKICDNVILALYLAQFMIKIIGLGPEGFMRSKWALVDVVLIALAVLLEIFPRERIPTNGNVLVKMFRFYKIASFLNVIAGTKRHQYKNNLYVEFKQLLSQTAIIIPIVIRFLPVLLAVFYILAALAMDLFYSAQFEKITSYNRYEAFTSFFSLIPGHLVLIQVLYESAWSNFIFDYSVRLNQFGLVLAYFIICHLCIVLIFCSLVKGLVWEIYLTVQEAHEEEVALKLKVEKQIETDKRKQNEIDEVKSSMETNASFEPDTILKREIYENRLDKQIFKKIISIHSHLHEGHKDKKRGALLTHLVTDRNIELKDIEVYQSQHTFQSIKRSRSAKQLFGYAMTKTISKDEVTEEPEIDQQIEELMGQIILNSKIRYSEGVVYPKEFTSYLEARLVNPFRIGLGKAFDLNVHRLGNKASVEFHLEKLDEILEVQITNTQQRAQIIRKMLESGTITEEDASKLLDSQSSVSKFNVNSVEVLRRMFLHEFNPQLLAKMQLEYFSDIYGQSFKDLNKIDMEPIIRVLGTLTYSLRSILRYPNIASQSFFRLLTQIQDKISNKLLKQGSLFKFVYQLEGPTDSWFTVEFKDYQATGVHFIKSGIWVYNKTMQSRQIYYGKDIFKWDLANRLDRAICEKYLKLFYQSFETLAYGLNNEQLFFQSTPATYIYDLFSTFIDTQNIKRLTSSKMKVSKIMTVILAKDQERASSNKITYPLSDLKTTPRTRRSDFSFEFGPQQNEIIVNLKNMTVSDEDRILKNDGLPYAYILDLMEDIREIVNAGAPVFLSQVETMLNNEFNENLKQANPPPTSLKEAVPLQE